MSSGMPELGSKISLISKADIRYEGRLFTVDPQECTIALASVRSFGTEDRETQYPVAPQNQVYDYILFRGSDIKDIRVVNNVSSTLPNDPAIMQLSVPPSLGPVGATATYQTNQFSHHLVGHSQYPAYHPMGGLPPAIRPAIKAPSELTSQAPPSNDPIGPPLIHAPQPIPPPVQAVKAKDQGTVLDLIGAASIKGGSRSNTPGPVAHRKSPTADQGTQAGSGVGGGGQRNPRNAVGSEERRTQQRRQPQQHQQNQQNRQQNQPQQAPQNTNNNQRLRPRSRNSNSQVNQNQQQPQQQQSHQTHQYYQQSNRGSGPGGWRGSRGARGGRGGSSGAIIHPQMVPHHQQRQQRPPARPKNTLKFENDYDFEQANTEFEELRNQLAKTKISDGDIKAEVTEAEKKDDSGNETGAGEPEPEEEQPQDNHSAYDKTKSFFDNISCEAIERSLGRSQRTDWRTERKLNSETFGVASARRAPWRGARTGWRGPWRGRGQHHRGGTRHQQHHAQQHVQSAASN